jgi:hypothetical protein
MNIRKLIKEEINSFEWAEGLPETITTESDIEHFLGQGIYHIPKNANQPNPDDEGIVVDLKYWIEHNGEEPEAYNVCWMEDRRLNELPDDIKVCTRFWSKSIVKHFNKGEFVFIDNYEG